MSDLGCRILRATGAILGERYFKVPALLVLLALSSSCDRFQGNPHSKLSDRFGVSYDDCILRSVSAGLSTESVSLVRQACVHAWERDSEEPASVEVSLARGSGLPHLEFRIENTGDNVATRVQIGVNFKAQPKPEKLYWTFPINLEPGQAVNLTGSFADDKLPSQEFSNIVSDTQFVRILPVKKAAAVATTEASKDD